MTAVLHTERLTLRPITIDDVDLLVELDGDPEVMAFITGGKPSSRDEVVATVENAIGSRWVAFDSSSEFIGWFGIPQSAPGEYELGYRLRKDAWGKGYATEGGRALIEYAFVALHAKRVWAQTMFINARSRSVMERCGMTYVRTFHEHFDDPIPGTEHGEVEYEIRANAGSA